MNTNEVQSTQAHYPSNIAIIATVMDNDTEEKIGVTRYALTDKLTAGFAIVVADAWQGRGVATVLLQRLTALAKQAGESGQVSGVIPVR